MSLLFEIIKKNSKTSHRLTSLLCSADIDQLLQYGHLVELYPSALFRDRLLHRHQPSCAITKTPPFGFFEICFRQDLQVSTYKLIMDHGIEKKQRSKSIGLVPLRNHIHSFSTI